MKEGERVRRIVSTLEKAYPGASIALNFSNPLECLIATMLSAQCTDKRVNEVTKELFKKYTSAKDYAEADANELQEDIRSTGFYKQKTRWIQGATRKIVEMHDGKVPRTMEDLTALPGVARKTANIVLGNAFGKVGGFAVDTHVKRLSFRLGFTKEQKNTDRIERDLMRLLPRDKWFSFSYALIEHGRAVCKSRKPHCSSCPVGKLCPRNGVGKSA